MDRIKGVIVLAVLSLLSASSLAVMYSYAKDQIEENKEMEVGRAISAVFEGARDSEKKESDGITGFKVYGAEKRLLGYAVKGSGTGYQGDIVLIIGVSPDFARCTGICVVESVETPGLGARIKEEDFRARFRGASLERRLVVVKGGGAPEKGTIDAVTGATISSRAVVRIVNMHIEKARELFGAEKRVE